MSYIQKSYIPKFGNVDNPMENNIIEDIAYLVQQSNSGGDSPSYKVYTALLSQSGTNAPVAIVLQNTLGGAVTYEYFTEEAPGSYKILSDNLFLGDLFIPQLRNNSNVHIQFQKISNSEIHVFTNNDNLMTKLPLEIRVYQ